MKYEKGKSCDSETILTDQDIVVYAILNQDISLLASNTDYLLTSEYIKYIYQAKLVYLLLS